MRMKRSPSNLPLVSLLFAAASFAAGAEAAPDASLKDVMKKMQAQVLNGDAKPLSAMFDATNAKAKAEFADWNTLVAKGKAAAEKGDLDGAKAVCKSCHDAYRNDYKTKYGSKAP
jgi:hypothetical protein